MLAAHDRRGLRATSASPSARSTCRRDRRSSIGSDEMWEQAEGALATALRGAGDGVRDQRRRRRVLRPEDRLRLLRRAQARLAAGDDAARLRRAAGAFRPQVRASGRQRGAPGDDPPRHPRRDRALHGDPDRALRRRVSALARSRAGAGADPDRAPARSTAARFEIGCATSRCCGPSSTTATKSSATRCARRRWRRFRTPWSSVTTEMARRHGGTTPSRRPGRGCDGAAKSSSSQVREEATHARRSSKRSKEKTDA